MPYIYAYLDTSAVAGLQHVGIRVSLLAFNLQGFHLFTHSGMMGPLGARAMLGVMETGHRLWMVLTSEWFTHSALMTSVTRKKGKNICREHQEQMI